MLHLYFWLVAHICVFTFCLNDVCLSCLSYVHCLCLSWTNILPLCLSFSHTVCFLDSFPPCHSFPFCGLILWLSAFGCWGTFLFHALHPSFPYFHSSTGRRYSIMCPLSNDSVLSAGFQIDTPDNLGRTCLHAAAAGGWVSRSCRSGFGLLDGM